MAPDLNSLPPSPFRNHHPISSSRRSSELRSPATASTTSSNTQPLVSSFPDHLASTMSSSGTPTVDNTGVGVGPGPLRHPRPLTAADLYMQMEKEQEAVVNRLTRELTALRQQTASVASNTSSTSAGITDVVDPTSNNLLVGGHHPTQSRRHRSSSSISRNANPSASSASGSTSGSTIGTTAGVAGSSTSGIAPPRDASAQYGYPRDPLSRQSSAASRRSEASSPSLSSSLIQNDHFPNMYAHRPSGSVSRPPPPSALPDVNVAPRSSHISPVIRYEEVDRSRIELDDVKRENEALKRRIRELERALNSRPSESDRTRSGSVSTSASVPPSSSRDRPIDNDDDGVGIGESAASVGIGGGH